MKNQPVDLLDLPHSEARSLLASTDAPVFLPVNPVEYHGPHLPLHNDGLVSQGLSRDLHAELARRHPDWPFLAVADLEIGVEPARGPGSRHTPFAVARRLVLDACHALAELGAKRVVLMTFHGSPLHGLALQAGLHALEARGVRALSPLNGLMQELLVVDGTQYREAFEGIADPEERETAIRDLPLDFHGGFFETSMTLHYAPDSVSPSFRTLPPCPPVPPNPAALRAASIARGATATRLARELQFAAYALGWQALDPFPGYTGRPHLASPEAGATFARLIVARYAALAEDVFAGRGRSPEPIMKWLAAATLGGRVPTAAVE